MVSTRYSNAFNPLGSSSTAVSDIGVSGFMGPIEIRKIVFWFLKNILLSNTIAYIYMDVVVIFLK